jgi:hypothetical protein
MTQYTVGHEKIMRHRRNIRTSAFLLCVAALVAVVNFLTAAEPPATLEFEGVSDNCPKALRAVNLVEAGDFTSAKDVLLSLTQRDFARKPRMEIVGGDQMGVVPVPAIGNRDLLLARCHMELQEDESAQVLLWGLIQKEYTEQDLFMLFVREFHDEKFALAVKKLDAIQKDFPRNDAALLGRQYLTVAHALPKGDIAAAVSLIRSGAWSRNSERGPQGEFKEWTCVQLAKYPQATVPVLIDALAANEQPTWIIYCLGLSGSQRALAPLEKAMVRIKNYYAGLEIDTAIARIKKVRKQTVEPSAEGDGLKPAP